MTNDEARVTKECPNDAMTQWGRVAGALVPGARGRIQINPGKTKLAEIGETTGPLSLNLCPIQNWQQQGGEGGNGSYNRQQLDEREPPSSSWRRPLHNFLVTLQKILVLGGFVASIYP